jgi:homocysteine S-methyltransferase
MKRAEIRSLFTGDTPLILDGGLGSELSAQGFDLSSSLWSADLILQNPQAIEAVHRSYLDAGARCIITSSYQASIPGLKAAGYADDSVEAVFRDAVAIARRAVDAFLQDNPDCSYRPLVAASIGPYGAYLADGSEYRGNYGVESSELEQFHAQRLFWLDDTGADLLACETIPDLQEARVLAELLKATSTPSWVSFCCRDALHLHDENRISDAVALFTDLPSVMALGANCVAPDFVTDLIENFRTLVGDKAIVIYPNSGAQYDARRKCWYDQETSLQFLQQAQAWRRAGAQLIGGCCRIGPDHIRQLAEHWGQSKVVEKGG